MPDQTTTTTTTTTTTETTATVSNNHAQPQAPAPACKPKRRTPTELIAEQKKRKEALLDQVKKLDQQIREKEAAQRKLAASAERKTRTRALIQLGLLVEDWLARKPPEQAQFFANEATRRQAKAKADGNKRGVADMEILLPLIRAIIDRATKNRQTTQTPPQTATNTPTSR